VSRRRNPRVEMREKMMEAKRWLNHMTLVWSSASYTYDQVETDGRANYKRRKLRPDERAENRAGDLRDLITYMNGVIVRAEEVRSIAQRRLRELEDGRG
jgi:hypothetical protein